MVSSLSNRGVFPFSRVVMVIISGNFRTGKTISNWSVGAGLNNIPPQDPRSGVTKNEIPNYVNEVKDTGNWWLEQKLNNYSESKSMNHGFQDSKEAAKFENLMSTYRVDTVYLSHIHSYLEYTKDGVRYLITDHQDLSVEKPTI